MSEIGLLAPVFVGAAVMALIWAVLSIFFSEERRVSKRLKALDQVERDHAGEIEPLTKSFGTRVVASTGSKAAALVRALLPTNYLDRLKRRLRLAGPSTKIGPEIFVALKVVGGIAGFGLGLYAAGVLDAPLMKVVVPIVATAAGFLGPDAWLSGRIQTRQTAIRRALPDMLDMLMVSVEAGLGFDASLAKVVASTKGPLSEEFAVMLQETQAGMPRRDSLQRLADRTDVPELTGFIMAIVQADVFGVSIANVLRSQAREMRVRRRQLAEEMAQKAPAKMVFPLIVCIMPATLIVVGAPAIISIGRGFGLLG